MSLTDLPPVVFVVESSSDDEMLTLRALSRMPLPVETVVERTGDWALRRYESEFAGRPPRLVIVADRLVGRKTLEVVIGMRAIHPKGTVPILHLLASEEHAPAHGVDAWLVKPMEYREYMEGVGREAMRLIQT